MDEEKDLRQKKIIASNIKKYMKIKKVNQKETAKAVGIKPSTMSDYMNYRSKPSHGVIQKLADYFEVGKSDIDTTYKDTSDGKLEDIENELIASLLINDNESLAKLVKNCTLLKEDQINIVNDIVTNLIKLNEKTNS